MISENILIVTDIPLLRRVLTMRLERLGATVLTAFNYSSGLESAFTKEMDLIITDADMPNMEGLKLCQELKTHQKTRHLPVIFISALEAENDIARGFEAGAAAYVTKNSTDSELTETISEVLSKSAFKQERHILVVDDSYTILRLTETVLARAGFQVTTAINGLDALEKMKEQKPDLVISDLDMPIMNGIEFFEALAAQKETSSIPFIIISSNTERSQMRDLIQRGAAAYMVKPVNMEQLGITAEKLLSEQFQTLLRERERLKREQNLTVAAITSLVKALEARDTYTRGHSERVAEIATGMAKIHGCSLEELETINLGGKLHDIGKIGIPDGLLLKPGKLEESEIMTFRKHPEIGGEILDPIASLKKILPIVMHHHERTDGQGYPHGLKGDDSPFLARIVSVADCYDAITSDRPYRKGREHSFALQIINEIRDIQLCSKCVDLFERWSKEGDNLKNLKKIR